MSSHVTKRQCISTCIDECAKFWLSSLQLYNSVTGIVVTNRAFVANVLSENLGAHCIYKNSAAQFRYKIVLSGLGNEAKFVVFCRDAANSDCKSAGVLLQEQTVAVER